MLLFAAGFALSLFGSLPPGLISLTVSQTSIARGFLSAMVLAAGAASAEFFQAWVAVLLTDWFLSHPGAERMFQWAAMPVFFILGIHLLFFAKPPRPFAPVIQSSLFRQFFKGVFVSIFNLLAIPYWFVYCNWLQVEGWWQTGLFSTLIFALGVSVGTLFALGWYAWLGQIILRRSSQVARYANTLIGLIFLGIGLKVLWGLI